MKLCEDCPPVRYPTEKTRCDQCPRRKSRATAAEEFEDGDNYDDGSGPPTYDEEGFLE